MINEELRNLIKELSETNCNNQIYIKLKELGHSVSLTTILRIVSSRIIIIECKICGNEFEGKGRKKYCTNCKTGILNKKDLNKYLIETINITGLKKDKIIDLLKKYTHSEIRQTFKNGKQIRTLPIYIHSVGKHL